MTYQDLLINPDVRRWYDNVARGSRITADVYLRRLGSLCRGHYYDSSKTSLNELKRARKPLPGLRIKMRARRPCGLLHPLYIHSTLNALKSWLAHNRRELKTRIKIRGVQRLPLLERKEFRRLGVLSGRRREEYLEDFG